MQFVSLDFIARPVFIFGVELEPNSQRLIYEFVYAYWNFSTNSLIVVDHEESHDIVYTYAKNKLKVHVWLPALQVKLIAIFHFFMQSVKSMKCIIQRIHQVKSSQVAIWLSDSNV